MIAPDAITIRPAVETDVALIYSSWLRSYWNATMVGSGVLYAAYQEGQRARIARLIDCVEIACSPAAPDTIMGWRCSDDVALHYLYVRQPYRHQGIGRYLLATWGWKVGQPLAALAATHMTPVFARAFPHIPFNPYLLEQT